MVAHKISINPVRHCSALLVVMRTRMRRHGFGSAGCFIVILLSLTGCASLYGRIERRQNASVVDFLFPKGSPEEQPSVPVLQLPVDVGIAFVPATIDRFSGQELSEERKVSLLRDVAREFDQFKFVRRIEIIPSNYLRPGGSFANLDQAARMFGVQVIALVSYDQMQFTDEDFVSFAYWTIVGAYVIEGEKNDTQTLLDAVVYDVASRKLLFRAPGVSRIEARSTPVNLSEELRDDADRGFQLAATNLVAQLKTELATFQERVRNRPEDVKFVARPGYTGPGAGALGLVEVMMLGVLGGAGWMVNRSKAS
jgi:rhombotail lipoprotein